MLTPDPVAAAAHGQFVYDRIFWTAAFATLAVASGCGVVLWRATRSLARQPVRSNPGPLATPVAAAAPGDDPLARLLRWLTQDGSAGGSGERERDIAEAIDEIERLRDSLSATADRYRWALALLSTADDLHADRLFAVVKNDDDLRAAQAVLMDARMGRR